MCVTGKRAWDGTGRGTAGAVSESKDLTGPVLCCCCSVAPPPGPTPRACPCPASRPTPKRLPEAAGELRPRPHVLQPSGRLVQGSVRVLSRQVRGFAPPSGSTRPRWQNHAVPQLLVLLSVQSGVCRARSQVVQCTSCPILQPGRGDEWGACEVATASCKPCFFMLHGFIPLAACCPLSVGATVASWGRVCAGVGPQDWDLVYRVGAACELAAVAAAGPCLGSKPGGTSAHRIRPCCV